MKMFKSHEAPPLPEFIYKWPFRDMSVGDMVEFDAEEDADLASKGQKYAYIYGRRTGRKFKTRKTSSGGLRVWRVE